MTTSSTINVGLSTPNFSLPAVLSALVTAGWKTRVEGKITYLVNANDEFSWSRSINDLDTIIALLSHEYSSGNIVGITLHWKDTQTQVDVLFHPNQNISFVLVGVRIKLKESDTFTNVSWYLERLLTPLEQALPAMTRVASVNWSEFV